MIVWLQAVGVGLIAVGSFLVLVTSIGMIRLRSLYARMHASTKPQVLGVIVMCAGLACVMQKSRVSWTLLLVVILQLVVAPISAHMLGRAVYRLRQLDRDVIVMDEYGEDLARAERHLHELGEADGVASGDPMPPPTTNILD